MTVFKRLFRQASSATGTAQAEPEAAARTETQAAAAAEQDAQQAAALATSGDVTELRRLGAGGSAVGEAVRKAAQARLLALLESGELADETQLADLALHGPSPAVRQRAAEGVHSPELVSRLLRDARGGDKNVYRIVKAKRDAALAAERAAEARRVHLANVCASLERHVHQPYGHGYVDALDHLENEWRAAESEADDALRVRAESALERARAVVTRHVQEQARLAAEQLAREAHQERARIGRSETLQSLRTLLARIAAAEAAPANAGEAATLQAAWRGFAELDHAPREEQQHYERLVKGIAALSGFNARHGSLAQVSAALAADPAAGEDSAHALRALLDKLGESADALPEVATAASALRAWEQARHEKQEAAAAQLRQVQGLLRKAQAALSDGHSRPAAGLRRAIEEKLPTLAEVPASFATALQAFDAKLEELQDWRRFAVVPKRAELIERIEALVGSELPPPELAVQIKRLQDEWKLVSQGNTDDTQAEWQRFHEAARKAYEPCKAYYTRQAEQRAAQLEKRRALLERLQAFASGHDWEHADWPLVARALRESAQQWRSAQPVERAANRPLQQAFDALRADLQQRLDAEYARNVAAREALIERARRAAQAEDARQGTDEIKRLQQSWQALGPVANEDSQRLWQAFREQCDAAFARRQQQQDAHTAQRSANAQQAAALCEQVEALANLSGAELIEGLRGVPALREQAQALGELPRAEAGALRQRFERAVERAERQLSQERARQQAQVRERVYEAVDALRRLRLLRTSGAADAEVQVASDALQALLQSASGWPKQVLAQFKVESGRDGGTDPESNAQALRLLCVRAELLAEVATPQADLPLRREYQMQQLTRGLGQARIPRREGLDALLMEWLAVGATREEVHAPLLARFRACRERAAA